MALLQVTINNLGIGRDVDETLRLLQAHQFLVKHGEVGFCCSCSCGCGCWLLLLALFVLREVSTAVVTKTVVMPGACWCMCTAGQNTPQRGKEAPVVENGTTTWKTGIPVSSRMAEEVLCTSNTFPVDNPRVSKGLPRVAFVQDLLGHQVFNAMTTPFPKQNQHPLPRWLPQRSPANSTASSRCMQSATPFLTSPPPSPSRRSAPPDGNPETSR